jgi:uncharacterized membrane protein YjgN (DUF898 family)
MPFCPNPDCDHRRRLGESAEFLEGVTKCSDCGSTLSKTAPHFEAVREPEKVTGWTCPQCGLLNREDISLCSCGYDVNRPALTGSQNPLKVFAWHCPQCDLTNYKDIERCSCGYEPRKNQQRELTVKFHGSSHEYFRIWIVNLSLTLFTLGIFSAWAKVRKKRYFYSHTTVDGTPFQYLGQPIPILKGRMIAAAAFLTYYASSHFFTSLLPYVFAAGAVLAPWVLVRSAAFNARYSAFRNMTFHFEGKYLGALKALYLWGIIPVFVLGMMFNWWGKYAIAGVAVFVFGVSFPWWIRRLRNFLISHSSYGNRKGTFSATGGQFFGVYFRSGLIMAGILIVAGLFSPIMTVVITKKPQLKFWLVAVPMYAGYVLAYAYVQAHSSNLVWNHTRLGPLRFQSTLRGMGMAKLYVTNAIAIIASLGLLIPWAVMRTLKYRADHMRVLQERELAEFQGSDMSAVEAIGAETVDFFDMDLSL